MECKEKYIKEKLTAYLAGELAPEDQSIVERHLLACGDCCSEAGVLGALAGEPVPDPGDEFWEANPDRIYRAFQMDIGKERGKRWTDIPRLWERVFPRQWVWVSGALAAALVLVVVLLPRLHRVNYGTVDSGQEAYEQYETLAFPDTLDLNVLNATELGTVDSWATGEFASLGSEIGEAVGIDTGAGFFDELSELNPQQLERLSTLLDEWEKEV